MSAIKLETGDDVQAWTRFAAESFSAVYYSPAARDRDANVILSAEEIASVASDYADALFLEFKKREEPRR